jgi:outer membrane putative beta-barrel porin/alpha-amylase
MRYVMIAFVMILTGVAPALGADGDPRWSFSTFVNYSVGDYGTDEDTTIVYIPFTLAVRPVDRLSVSLTLPYIYQSSENVVVTAGGVAVRKGGSGKFARPARSTSESGLGDLLLKASYIVLEESEVIPEIAPYLKTKFPTADSDRGLGTGEFDETIGVDLSKRLIDRLFGYLTLAYTFVGDPPGTDFRNSFGWSLGAAYAVSSPIAVFAFLDGSTAISPGQSDPVELRVGAEYRLTKALKLTGSVARGLTDGAADWGLSAGLAVRF